MWSGLEDVLIEEIRKHKFAFDVVLEAFSSQVKVDDFINNQNWSRAFNAVYQPKRGERILFKKVRLDYKEAAGFLSGTFDTNQTRQPYAELSQSGEIYVSAKSANSHITVDVPAVEIDSKIQMVGGITAQKRIVAIQGGSGLLEVMSGLWVLAELAKANDAAYELFEEDKYSKILDDDRLVIAATMASITDGLMRVGQAMRLQAAGTNAASAAATKTLFQGKLPNAIFSTLYSPALEASSGIGRAAALWLPRISAGLGAIVAGGAAYRASQTGDRAALIGNAMMAVSSVIMVVPGANAVVVVSAVFIYAVGFGISLLSYSSIEDVVRVSFWGSSDEYLEGDRLPLDEQIRDVVAAEKTKKYEEYYHSEVRRFEDIIWGIRLTLVDQENKNFRIESPLISEKSPDGLGFNSMRIFFSFGREHLDVNVDLADFSVSGKGAKLINVRKSGKNGVMDVINRYDGNYSFVDWSIIVEIKRRSTGRTFRGVLTGLK
ncbi:hypothetical protein LF95_23830 [Thalassospira sp. TSL5-1]|nr:hypothetical protein LF95_23830 [Thalassospira sp. TSL5-1]